MLQAEQRDGADERKVPKLLVVLACALVLALPAAFASGAIDGTNYHQNTSGSIQHRSAWNFKTYVKPMSTISGLAARVKEARSAWNAKLTDDARTAIKMPAEPNEPLAEIKVAADDLPNTVKVSVPLSVHPAETTVIAFNTDHAGGMSGSERRTRACRAFGEVLGMKPKSTYTDCMSTTLGTEEVSAAHVSSIVDPFYGPKLSPFSGTLWNNRRDLNRTVQRSGSYGLSISATGHELSSMTVQIQALRTLSSSMPGAPVTVASGGPAACVAGALSQCTITLSPGAAALGLATKAPGTYRITAKASIGSSVQRVASFDFDLDYPWFGFNAPWARGDWVADTGPTGAYVMAEGMNPSTARFNVPLSTVYGCNGAENWGPTQAAMTRMAALQIKPVLVLIDGRNACDPAHPGDFLPTCPTRLDENGNRDPVRGTPPPPTAAGDARLAYIASQVATKWGDEVLGIEVWNEANAESWWGGCDPSPANYDRMLNVAATAIHAVDPSIRVVTAGMDPLKDSAAVPPEDWGIHRMDWEDFLTQMSLGTVADVTGIHTYRRLTDCNGVAPEFTFGGTVTDQIDAIKAIAGLPAPVWDTEFGVSTSGNDCRTVSQAEQGPKLVEMYNALNDEQVRAAFLHGFGDSSRTTVPSYLTDWELGTGIATLEVPNAEEGPPYPVFAPKPAYCSVKLRRGYSAC